MKFELRNKNLEYKFEVSLNPKWKQHENVLTYHGIEKFGYRSDRCIVYRNLWHYPIHSGIGLNEPHKLHIVL